LGCENRTQFTGANLRKVLNRSPHICGVNLSRFRYLSSRASPREPRAAGLFLMLFGCMVFEEIKL
jgi:hypothetical protein